VAPYTGDKVSNGPEIAAVVKNIVEVGGAVRLSIGLK
jgi:hypothetical protein